MVLKDSGKGNPQRALQLQLQSIIIYFAQREKWPKIRGGMINIIYIVSLKGATPKDRGLLFETPRQGLLRKGASLAIERQQSPLLSHSLRHFSTRYLAPHHFRLRRLPYQRGIN